MSCLVCTVSSRSVKHKRAPRRRKLAVTKEATNRSLKHEVPMAHIEEYSGFTVAISAASGPAGVTKPLDIIVNIITDIFRVQIMPV